LLVPRAGQAERLVPGGQLHRAGTRRAGQGHAQHLQYYPGHVVLRLRLGQAERVDLHAVPEAALFLVRDAVAGPGDLVPQHDEGPHLRHLLDEAHARVDEEGDPGHHVTEAVRRNLAAGADRVEHRDRGGEREANLLYRRGTGLLEVVRADVDRVPLGQT